MPNHEEFKIPDLKAILEKSKYESKKWASRCPQNLGKKNIRYQASFPQDPQLAKKLGICRKDRLFIFAGSYGDWANALSKICFVIYSDLSKEILNHALQKYPCLRRSACIADGALLPLPKNIDWLFSFEPIPLESAHLPLILLQGMSGCNKGIMTAYGYNRVELARLIKMSEIADLYRAKYTTSKIPLSNKNTELPPYSPKADLYIYKLETNPTAKACATLDLKIILQLQKKRAGAVSARPTLFFDGVRTDAITNDTIAKVAEAHKEGIQGILESLRRITKISELIEDEPCIKRYSFNWG